ncbi:hypothetical protein GCM10011391_37890 [Pullulanibacillus camelliae]|uniref:YtxH domain-containing protein n=1 Tax=Pullulanibacillus camelliae TaxID=1707096 RepID=A0A8J2YN55_9BACL|nr:YtxH domain-containing protein [Pullulanibacillus camelliae]GGE55300.1 hypothetical protein GCM10011391_37890 [Pullulanibacillus camelliae]
MSNDNHNINTKDFLIGALVGGIVGGVTALLFAPKSGKELRGDLNAQSQAVKRKGGDLAVIAKEKSASLAKTVSEQSAQLANKMKDLPDSIGINTRASENTAVTGIELNKETQENDKVADAEEEK